MKSPAEITRSSHKLPNICSNPEATYIKCRCFVQTRPLHIQLLTGFVGVGEVDSRNVGANIDQTIETTNCAAEYMLQVFQLTVFCYPIISWWTTRVSHSIHSVICLTEQVAHCVSAIFRRRRLCGPRHARQHAVWYMSVDTRLTV
jgi:hypothetical protein